MPLLARGTFPIVLAPAAAGLVLLVLPVPYAGWIGAGLLAASLLAAAFFRDPDRAIGAGVVAPADGRIRSVEADEDGLHIVTFMNLHDVHVNRAPLGGTVVERTRAPGPHLPAFLGGSEGNERVEWTLETDAGTVRMSQVAGTFARRIDPWVPAGEPVDKGDRLGIVRFGSRVDLTLPPGLEPAVEAGDRVRAAEDTLAEAPP